MRWQANGGAGANEVAGVTGRGHLVSFCRAMRVPPAPRACATGKSIKLLLLHPFFPTSSPWLQHGRSGSPPCKTAPYDGLLLWNISSDCSVCLHDDPVTVTQGISLDPDLSSPNIVDYPICQPAALSRMHSSSSTL